MTDRQEVEAPAVDMYPRKILEYMEGFLISKVRKVVAESIHTRTHTPATDTNLRKILEYMEGFLVSKVRKVIVERVYTHLLRTCRGSSSPRSGRSLLSTHTPSSSKVISQGEHLHPLQASDTTTDNKYIFKSSSFFLVFVLFSYLVRLFVKQTPQTAYLTICLPLPIKKSIKKYQIKTIHNKKTQIVI